MAYQLDVAQVTPLQIEFLKRLEGVALVNSLHHVIDYIRIWVVKGEGLKAAIFDDLRDDFIKFVISGQGQSQADQVRLLLDKVLGHLAEVSWIKEDGIVWEVQTGQACQVCVKTAFNHLLSLLLNTVSLIRVLVIIRTITLHDSATSKERQTDVCEGRSRLDNSIKELHQVWPAWRGNLAHAGNVQLGQPGTPLDEKVHQRLFQRKEDIHCEVL